jgi:N-dimethylarginine dimethylaminohydrolase
MNDTTQLFPNGRWLLCKPDDYDVRYKINPWMDPQQGPKKELALAQWTDLHDHLIHFGARVEYVPHAHGLPDMVFTANAGLVRGLNVVLSRFRHPERQGEEAHFQRWFEDNGYTVHKVAEGSFEGEGDALFVGDLLVGGFGFRSDERAYPSIQSALGVRECLQVKLVDPRFYHLDTCFCPLDSSTVLLYPGAFSPESLAQIENRMKVIPVEEKEALRFVCNAVIIGRDIVLPAGCPTTYTLLHGLGFATHPVELSEFIKAGGAAKCLSLKL